MLCACSGVLTIGSPRTFIEVLINTGMPVNLKNSEIMDQNKLIEEKTKLLNSRTRQIELGISQNNYKKNIMWMLIIINII